MKRSSSPGQHQRWSRARGQLSAARSVTRFIWTHPANDGKRVRQLARAVAFQVSSRLGRTTTARLGDSAVLRVPPHVKSASKVVYANPPDYHEMMAWRQIIRSGDLFLDVGANVGTYSLWAADLGANVLAFEPHPDSAANLRLNVELNQLPIIVYEVALGESAGKLRLTRGLDSMNHMDFSDSPDSVQVDVLTLDSVIGGQGDFLMKIDVEGAEELVLRGGSVALASRQIRAMQLEWNSLSVSLLGSDRRSLANLLASHGYHFSRPDVNGNLRACDPRVDGSDIFVTRDPIQGYLSLPL